MVMPFGSYIEFVNIIYCFALFLYKVRYVNRFQSEHATRIKGDSKIKYIAIIDMKC